MTGSQNSAHARLLTWAFAARRPQERRADGGSGAGAGPAPVAVAFCRQCRLAGRVSAGQDARTDAAGGRDKAGVATQRSAAASLASASKSRKLPPKRRRLTVDPINRHGIVPRPHHGGFDIRVEQDHSPAVSGYPSGNAGRGRSGSFKSYFEKPFANRGPCRQAAASAPPRHRAAAPAPRPPASRHCAGR